MRGMWGVTLLVLAMAGLACKNKPRREIRPPAVQSYDLPPMDMKQYSEAPTYPEDRANFAARQKGGTPNMAPPSMGGMSAGGGGAGMGNPGMPGGPGGFR